MGFEYLYHSFCCIHHSFLGRVADILGRNKVYMIGLLLFLIGSFASGSAMSVAQLVLSRGIQAIGAAIVFPTSMTIGMNTVELKIEIPQSSF